ncbi:serine/threonine-protein kinase STY46 [Pelomyxa schiedti]|nr:serine/threonine-protein kinase STY46 [Pelomyxa schiedti]
MPAVVVAGVVMVTMTLCCCVDAFAVPTGLEVVVQGRPAVISGQTTAEFLNPSDTLFAGNELEGEGSWIWTEDTNASCTVLHSFVISSSEESIETDIVTSTSLNQTNKIPHNQTEFRLSFQCEVRAVLVIQLVFIVYLPNGTIYKPVTLQFLKVCRPSACRFQCVHGYCDLNLTQCVCNPGWHSDDCSTLLVVDVNCPGEPISITYGLYGQYPALDWFSIYQDPFTHEWLSLEWRYFSSWTDVVPSDGSLTGNLTGTKYLDTYLSPGDYLLALFLSASTEVLAWIPFTIRDWVSCNLTSDSSPLPCVHGIANSTYNVCTCEPNHFWWDCSRGCSIDSLSRNMSGVVSSDNPPSGFSPLYLTSSNCTWLLQPGSDHYNFKLILEMVDLFTADIVIIATIQDQNSTPVQFTTLGHGTVYPQVFSVKNVNSIQIIFESDFIHTAQGFCINWTATLPEKRDRVATIWGVGVTLVCLQLMLVAVVGGSVFWWRRKRITIYPASDEKKPIMWVHAEEEAKYILGRGVICCEGLYVKPQKLTFGIPESVAFPVASERSEFITLYNRTPCEYTFSFYVPQEPFLFICNVNPGQGTLPALSATQVQVSFQLMYTTLFQRHLKAEVRRSTAGTLVSEFLFEISLMGEVSDNIDPAELTIEPAPIASGGFGVVYRGVYRKQMVAIKVPKRQHHLLDYELATFESEVKLMKSLHGKYIVTFIGASSVPGKLCIVTEFHELGSLSHFVHSAPSHLLTENLKVKIATDVANAMCFLHSHSVIYRDLKCTNILMVSTSPSSKLHCKLTDFGSAKNVPTLSELFSHTGCIGTPAYMAPEMLDNKPYNHKVDVYSFAIIFWEVLSQDHPWGNTKPWDIPSMVLSGSRPQLPDDSPSKCQDIISKCWRHDPDSRPEFSSILRCLKDMNPQRKGILHLDHQVYIGDAADGFTKSYKLSPLMASYPPNVLPVQQSSGSEQNEIQTTTSIKTNTTMSCSSRLTDVLLQLRMKSTDRTTDETTPTCNPEPETEPETEPGSASRDHPPNSL